jgi:hypothetical protein
MGTPSFACAARPPLTVSHPLVGLTQSSFICRTAHPMPSHAWSVTHKSMRGSSFSRPTSFGSVLLAQLVCFVPLTWFLIPSLPSLLIWMILSMFSCTDAVAMTSCYTNIATSSGVQQPAVYAVNLVMSTSSHDILLHANVITLLLCYASSNHDDSHRALAMAATIHILLSLRSQIMQ